MSDERAVVHSVVDFHCTGAKTVVERSNLLISLLALMNEIIEGVETESLNDKFNDIKLKRILSLSLFTKLIMSSQCVARRGDKTKANERRKRAEKRNRNCLLQTT